MSEDELKGQMEWFNKGYKQAIEDVIQIINLKTKGEIFTIHRFGYHLNKELKNIIK